MEKRRAALLTLLALSALLASSCGADGRRASAPPWDHVVIVWEENKNAAEVSDLPFIARLRAMGTTYSRSYGVARPSQPNYIAFFAGSLKGVADNGNHDLTGPTLSSRFADSGLSMKSYAEGLPSAGFRGASWGKYVRKHNPAASFPEIPDADILPFSAFPSDYPALPTLAFVIPDLDHDMHDGTPQAGDDWLRAELGAYAEWAVANRSLLILTFDEPNTSYGLDTPILTVFVGAWIDPGAVDDTPMDQYSFSDALLDRYGLPRLPH